MNILNKCNLCLGNNYENFLENIMTWEHKGSFNLVKCSNCGLIILNPRPAKSTIKRYYPKDEYWGWEVKKNLLKARSRDFFPIYELIFKYKNTGSILDIGTGSGYFLTEFKDHGWKVVGTDISEKAVNIAQSNYKLKVKMGFFESIKFKQNIFDVVTLNNVLEHLYTPKDTLLKINKLLKNNGLLVITVPNIESLGFALFKKYWFPLQPPRHLFHFSEKTLKRMLLDSGFEIGEVLYNYKTHIIYSLFESFRFKLSPKFKVTEKGGLLNKNYNWNKSTFLPRLFGKYFLLAVTHFMYYIEILFKKSEVITILAYKK